MPARLCTAFRVQPPLPAHIDEDLLVDWIDPASRGVDVFHAVNVGHLALRRFGLRPRAPNDVMMLLLGIP